MKLTKINQSLKLLVYFHIGNSEQFEKADCGDSQEKHLKNGVSWEPNTSKLTKITLL